MKKRILIVVGILVTLYLKGQSPYTFSVRQESYNELSNPISLNNGNEWSKQSTFAVYLDFEIPIQDGTVNSLNLNAGNGFDFPYSSYYNLFLFHWPFGGSLLLDRGYNTGVTQSPISYEIAGTEGDRIVKLEWKNAGFYMDIVENELWNSTNSDFIDFQIWLYENDGKIEIHIGPNSVLNQDSYGHSNGGVTGPFSKFIIGDNMIDLFGNADNPSYQWISNEGIQYGGMLIGIPSEGKVYEFTPDFYMSIIEDNSNNEIEIEWMKYQNQLIISNNKYGKGLVELFSIDGRKITSKEFESQKNHLSIDLKQHGIFIVKVSLNDRVISKVILN